jgi:hypothetical protein
MLKIRSISAQKIIVGQIQCRIDPRFSLLLVILRVGFGARLEEQLCSGSRSVRVSWILILKFVGFAQKGARVMSFLGCLIHIQLLDFLGLLFAVIWVAPEI